MEPKLSDKIVSTLDTTDENIGSLLSSIVVEIQSDPTGSKNRALIESTRLFKDLYQSNSVIFLLQQQKRPSFL